MNEYKISTQYADGKIVAVAKIDGKRRQATVKGSHTGANHAEAAFQLCQRAGIRAMRPNINTAQVKGGFDFTLRTD